MRLLAGQHGWWLRTGRRVALLPSEAVDSSGRIRDEVVRQLTERGVFASFSAETYYLTVLTATRCNLGCGYCFQNTGQAAEGRHDPSRIRTARLGSDTIDQILAFVDKQMIAAGTTGLHILLFGGEPLLNPVACVALLNRARDHGLTSASMTTNGVLLRPALARQLAEAGLTRAKITFDGGRAAHDKIRVTRGGAPTYDTIVANVVSATAAVGLKWDLRVNVSHHNADTIPDLIDDLSEQLDPNMCSFDFALIDDVGIGYANHLAYDGRMLRQFIDWHVTALERGFDVSPLASLETCVYCSTSRGATGAVVNADGRLYSCWESAGKEDWEVGDVVNGYLPDNVLTPRWVACDYDRVAPNPHMRRFLDELEAAVLDWRYEHNALAVAR